MRQVSGPPGPYPPPVDPATLRRYADLLVEIGANVQPGQIVFVTAEPRAAPMVRALA